MQATVKEFSDETRSGAVMLDDGTEIPMPAEAFARSGLRALRFGQRVRIEVDGEGESRRVSFVTLATF